MEEQKAGVTTVRVTRWLAGPGEARVLHVFEQSASFHRAGLGVIAVVNPEIGRGPFNLVLDQAVNFTAFIEAGQSVRAGPLGIQVGTLGFKTAGAENWDARPEWRTLHGSPMEGWIAILEQELARSPVQPALSIDVIPEFNTASLAGFARSIAGLGPGLTPSGDDILVGWQLGFWAGFSPGQAAAFGEAIAAAAAERTTTLSAAWLRASAQGEAGEAWHELVRAIGHGQVEPLRAACRRILHTGHSSGADALSGFIESLKTSQR